MLSRGRDLGEWKAAAEMSRILETGRCPDR